MVIQLSPQTESAHYVQERYVQEPESPAASSHKLKPDKNEPGGFAKILAALSTGAEDQEAKIPENDLAMADETSLIPASTEKDAVPLAAANEATNETDEPDSPSMEFSNIIFTVGRLTGQSEEQVTLGEEPSFATFATASATANAAEHLTASATAHTATVDRHSSRYEQETAKTETASAMASTGTPDVAATAETDTDTGKTAAVQQSLAAENPQHINEKAKNRIETAVNSGSAAEKVTGNELSPQTEAKKTITNEREGRNRRNASVEIHDFRTQAESSLKEASHLRTVTEARLPGEGSGKDIILELRLPNQGQSSATTSWEVRTGQAGQTLENMLARELHQNFNSDIVRHASVALRDGNEGTIRLALKPESLGNVKIHLELAENKIAGQIVVESEEALRAFKREISSLEKAFRDSGFDAANLEMSLTADGGQHRQEREFAADAGQFLPEFFAASRYDAAVERMEMPMSVDMYYQGSRAVNVFA